MSPAPAIRFLTIDGRRLAYEVTGDGPLLLAPAWWVSHLELDQRNPDFARFWAATGAGYSVVREYTGHGIGMEGHEPVNLVHGETTRLAPGMCFSNEPGIYLPGKFGVRLEDCFHMTASGPKFFSQPPPSIDQPFG